MTMYLLLLQRKPTTGRLAKSAAVLTGRTSNSNII
jgi:hypothetical protein